MKLNAMFGYARTVSTAFKTPKKRASRMASARSLISRTSAVAAAMVMIAASRAQADWAEVGDAGEAVGTVQTPVGSGAIGSITGSLSYTNGNRDVDIFRIFISNPSAFSASTVDNSTAFDTQLFLFTETGLGVRANDDAPNAASVLTNQSSLPTGSVASFSAGIYLLAISRYNRDPLSQVPASSLQPIFPDTTTGVVSPTGGGGAFPLAIWSGGSSDGNTYGYQIDLNGAVFVPLPPAAFAGLFGLAGVIGFAVVRRRRLR